MLSTLITGFVTGGALILVIGAQNAWVLRQGLRREHIGLVIVICAVSDALLVTLGTLGIGWVVGAGDWVLDLLKFGGAAYLLWMGGRSIYAAWKDPGRLDASHVASAGSVALTTLALTWLNPHVYLDTVVLLGSIANQYGATGRWWFASGAILASFSWFTALGLGARALAPLVARPITWRILDFVVGAALIVVAILLLAT